MALKIAYRLQLPLQECPAMLKCFYCGKETILLVSQVPTCLECDNLTAAERALKKAQTLLNQTPKTFAAGADLMKAN
jgi:hypothetical protein